MGQQLQLVDMGLGSVITWARYCGRVANDATVLFSNAALITPYTEKMGTVNIISPNFQIEG